MATGLNLLQDSPLNFNDLNFEFVQEESGGYFAPIDLGNGTTVTKTNSGQYEISGPQGGAIYDANGALLNSYVRTGARTGTMFDPQGNVVGSIDSSSRINEVLSDVFTPLAPAIPAILGTLALGPAGSGLLSGPAAAAAASGGNTLLQGGNIEDALKAAALAGATAYGFGELFPTGAAANTDAAFIAADAAQLAAQGLGEAQISMVLQASGVVPSVAANVAAAAAEGLNPQQIINEVGNLRFTAPVATPEGTFSSLNPNQVVIPGQAVVGAPFDLTALSGGLLTPPVVPAAPPVATPTQTTTVEGPRTTPETPTTVIPPIVPPVVPAAPTAVTPTQTTTIETSRTTPETPATVVTPVVAPVVPTTTTTEPTQTTIVEGTKTTEPPEVIIPSIPPVVVPSVVSPEIVEVTAKKPVSPEEPLIVIPPTTPLPPVPPEVAKPPVKPVNPPGESIFNPSDILKLLALLGGTSSVGGVGTGGTNIGSVPTSDTMLGSTTPQFGPDYYAAVQQYYNAYMPETPRNVAGPLQQWYENKYGA